MTTALSETVKSNPRYPDQLDEIVIAHAFPLELQPDVDWVGGQWSQRIKEDRDESVNRQWSTLRRAAGIIRDVQNAMVREWLKYHYINETAAKLAANQPGVLGLPTDLQLAMYHAAKSVSENLNSTCVTLALNFVTSTIRSQDSPRDNMRRWKAVLRMANSERPWFWSGLQPIRLDANNSSLEQVGGNVHLKVRIATGEPHVRFRVVSEKARSRNDKGRNAENYNERLAILRRDMSTKGGMLVEKFGRWQLSILERRDAPVLIVNPPREATMFVRTSYKAGWKVTWPGNRCFIIGTHELSSLGVARREQIAKRAEFRERRLKGQSKEVLSLSRYWRNYTRTLAQQSASDIITLAVHEGIKLIHVKAGDEWCALGQVGNEDKDKTEPTRFPFAEFGAILAQKAAREGIAVTSRPNLRSVKRRKALATKMLERDRVEAVSK